MFSSARMKTNLQKTALSAGIVPIGEFGSILPGEQTPRAFGHRRFVCNVFFSQEMASLVHHGVFDLPR
jgi:hypothetical protein